MSFAVDVQEVKDYVDILAAPGDYQAEIIKATEGMTAKDRPKIDLHLKVLDTLPAGEDIDEDNFENPVGSVKFATIYLPLSKTDHFMTKKLSDWLNNFDVEAENPGELAGSDFVGCVGGVKIENGVRFKDSNNPPEAYIDVSVPLD